MAQTNLITREIAREEWPEFLEGFSKQHRGWIVTVKVLGSDIGAQELATALPIQEVTAKLESPGKDEVAIILGRFSQAPWAHIVSGPSHIRFETTEDGAHQALEIVAADGITTLLQFQAGARPENVNGFLPQS